MLRKNARKLLKLNTPSYVYDENKINSNIDMLKKVFYRGNTEILYAAKANSSVSVLKLIRRQSLGVEVVSPGEIFLSLKAGFEPDRILYNSIARTKQDIDYALINGITLFNFEAIDQAKLLEHCAKKKKKEIKLFVRLNPSIFAGTHTHLSTGAPLSKFGIEVNELAKVIKLAKKFKYAKLVGLHSHIGSQILSSSPFIKAAKNCARILRTFRKMGIKMDYLNLGGGFGVQYSKSDEKLNFTHIQETYYRIAQKNNVKLFVEPGRFIIANAGFILTRIISKKMRNRTPLYIVDAGMTENPRPAIYRAHHHIELLTRRNGRKKKSRITGPLCENSNEFGTYSLPSLKIGDYLVIQNSGAYTRTMASNYNGRLLAEEYIYTGESLCKTRTKQTLLNLIENEKY